MTTSLKKTFEILNSDYSKEQIEEFRGASITNIKRGKGNRKSIVYAEIRNSKGSLLVSATLEYCTQRMEDISKFF